MGTFSTLVALAAFGLSPQGDLAQDTVDLIEVNHFYDEHGRLVFDQVIFYDWASQQGRYNVRAWRLLKTAAQIPTRDYATGEYETIWHDGDILRRVRGRAFRETWTQHDPELREREYLPKDQRRELVKVRVTSNGERP